MNSRLTVAALGACRRRSTAGKWAWCTIPIERVKYASSEYVATLDIYGLVARMSRPANLYDNLEQLSTNIKEFIEENYNRQRLHSALGYRPPEEFKQRSERGHLADTLGATMQLIVNDGNVIGPPLFNTL